MRKVERYVKDVVWIDGEPFVNPIERLTFTYEPETALERFVINCKSFSDSVAEAFMRTDKL